MLKTANRLSIGGLVLLTFALVGVVFLVTDLLFHAAAAVTVTAAVGAFFGWFWYGLPLWRRRQDPD
jgi:ABC-type uncharacterized transport system permease subunit